MMTITLDITAAEIRALRAVLKKPMKCESKRCYSPIACAGFGYCRELNLPKPKGEKE
jgi:hypothetical protein